MARNGSSPSAPRCHKRGHFTAGLAYKRMLSMLGFLVLLTVLPPSSGLKERDVLKHIFADYDKDERPPGRNDSLENGGPVVVSTNIFLRSIHSIDEQNMKLEIQITLRGSWFDPRLAFEDLSSENETVPQYVHIAADSPSDRMPWTPDTFFSNERESSKHEIVVPNRLLRIHNDGKVMYSERFSVTLDCHFYLNDFPFDQQECELKIASYSRTADDIVYKWQDIHPVQVREGALMVPSFGRFADDMETDYCDSNTNTGTYSCLRLTIKLQRTSWPYVIQLYVPTTMLVIIAWLAFSLDKKSTTARILLCIASLALIIAISLVVNSRVPLTAYVKSTDVWIGVCLAYVFYALVESVIVSSGADSPRSRKNEYNQLDQTTTPTSAPTADAKDRRSRLDSLSRLLYPLFFLFFVGAYVVRYAF